MSPQQREKKNERLRQWRKKKRQEDPQWAARQSAYSAAYAKKRRNDGTDFDEKRRRTKQAYYRRCAAKPESRAKIQQQSLESYRRTKAHPERAQRYRQCQNQYRKNRRKSDPVFAIRCALRSRLSDLVRNGHADKEGSALEYVGCGITELRTHLESQFLTGMSWHNYGTDWHIDHIIPCAKFNLKVHEERRQCFNYLNLRPCWAKDNIRKGDRIDKPSQIPLGI